MSAESSSPRPTKKREFALTIEDPDAHDAIAVHGANGFRMIRTFKVGEQMYIDARDAGFLLRLEHDKYFMRFALWVFWKEVAIATLWEELWKVGVWGNNSDWVEEMFDARADNEGFTR